MARANKKTRKKPAAPRTSPSVEVRRPLRVAVDFPWDASACMGTGAYSETMVRALAGVSEDVLITLVVGADAPRTVTLPNVRYETLPSVDALREGARQVALPELLRNTGADCLFAPATLLPLVKVCPAVATIHDLTFVSHPDYYGPGLLEYLGQWFDPSLRVADHFVAVSPESRDELLDLKGISGDRVTVIEQPVRETFLKPLERSEVRSRIQSLEISEPFFFHVSNLSPHKNVAFALGAFQKFLAAHPDAPHHFVFAGGGTAPNRHPDLGAIAGDLGIEDRVHYAGRVPDDLLKALYQGCEAFLFPSLAEGWGLPVAEAGALGARILASSHVPAASKAQRLPLDQPRWIEALGDAKYGRESIEPRSPLRAGQELLGVIRKVCERAAEVIHVSPPSPPIVKEAQVASPAIRLPGISGCTIIRNGVRLRYPFEESVASYASLCEEVVLSWDPTSEDETVDLVRRIAARFPNVRLIESAWDMQNRQEGTELARQTQIAFDRCRHEWTFYVQADEALHESHHDLLRKCASDLRLGGVAFQRLSFFETLEREIPDHHTRGMVRLFRTGCGRSIGDAMHVRVEGYPGGILDSDAKLFNYSRLGSDDDIINRCTNLHRFYHDEAWLAARDSKVELDIPTVPFRGTHPAPIEASFRRVQSAPTRPVPRVSAHVIAQEPDRFGADLLASCLDALEGYADQIVVVDNGLGPDALDVVLSRRGSLPITLLDGREVMNDFAELRNRALAATAPGISHIHKVDSDEVYLPGGLREVKELISDPSIAQVNAELLHFMIEPSLVESVQTKEVIFRFGDALAWRGAVHESISGLGGNRSVKGPLGFLHFGYCRPQWQTLIKWLRYALIQGSDLSHYKYEFLDGVRRPWFREGRSPDTILEPRRPQLQRYQGLYPPSTRLWLDDYARSGRSWREWVNRRAGAGFWEAWQALRRSKGSWEETLEEVLARWGDRRGGVPTPLQAGARPSSRPGNHEARSRQTVSGSPPHRRSKSEFRRGFSIIIPTWNNLGYLKKAVESIRRFSDFDHEIVLHVNEGSDGTLEWAKESGFKHTYTPENVGICVAINRMTDLCERDLVMYYNDDMVALPEWDRHLVEYAETHDIDPLVWLSSTLIEPTGDNPSFIAPADYGTHIEGFDEERLLADLAGLRVQKPDMAGTSWAPNLLYRETFDRVGRFSEEFSPGFGSDPDLAKKLWDIGMRHFMSVGKSLVYHFQCKGTGKIPKHLHNDAQGTFFRKHGLSIHDFIFGVLRRQARVPEPVAAPSPVK